MAFNSVMVSRALGLSGLLCSKQGGIRGWVGLFLASLALLAQRDAFDSFVMACWASSNSRPALCMGGQASAEVQGGFGAVRSDWHLAGKLMGEADQLGQVGQGGFDGVEKAEGILERGMHGWRSRSIVWRKGYAGLFVCATDYESHAVHVRTGISWEEEGGLGRIVRSIIDA